MPVFLTHIEHDSIAYSCALLLLVTAIDAVWQWPRKWHPISVVHLLALRMAAKVRPKNVKAEQQAIISGSLAFLVLFAPFFIVLYVLLTFAEYYVFFDTLLLLVAFNTTSQRIAYKRIINALATGKKGLAREWLKQLVKRDTQLLSDIGIAKAAMESLTLRYVYQRLTVAFLFFLGGGLLALIYRVALECRWAWKQPNLHSDYFVAPVTFLCRLCQWPMNWLMVTFVFCCIWPRNTAHQNRERVSTLQPRKPIINASAFVLRQLGRRLGFSLGGPLAYEAAKIRQPRLGASRQVRLSDMQALSTSLHVITGVSALILLAFLVIVLVKI